MNTEKVHSKKITLLLCSVWMEQSKVIPQATKATIIQLNGAKGYINEQGPIYLRMQLIASHN